MNLYDAFLVSWFSDPSSLTGEVARAVAFNDFLESIYTAAGDRLRSLAEYHRVEFDQIQRNAPPMLEQLAKFCRLRFTTGQLGVGWKAASGYSVLDGLWPLAVAVRGKYLIVSDNAAFLASALEGVNKKPSASAAVFAAAFDHQHERENFVTCTKMLDLGSGAPQKGGSPEFFSENMASLSFTLKGVSSEKIVIHDAADRQTQTVVYAWAQ